MRGGCVQRLHQHLQRITELKGRKYLSRRLQQSISGWSWARGGPANALFSATGGTHANAATSCHPATGTKTTQEHGTNLAAHRLLVLPAALLSALVGLDAEAGPASGAGGLAAGAVGFLLVLEQLHQQVKLQTAGRLVPPPRSC